MRYGRSSSSIIIISEGWLWSYSALGLEDALGVGVEVDFAAAAAEVVGRAVVVRRALGVADRDVHVADGVVGGCGGFDWSSIVGSFIDAP